MDARGGSEPTSKVWYTGTRTGSEECSYGYIEIALERTEDAGLINDVVDNYESVSVAINGENAPFAEYTPGGSIIWGDLNGAYFAIIFEKDGYSAHFYDVCDTTITNVEIAISL